MMKFLGSNRLFRNIKFDINDITQYRNVVVAGEHDYIEKGWGSIIFSGELYNEGATKSNYLNHLAECIQNKGVEGIAALNGKFIAVIFYQDKIYIARDQSGVHSPLYYNDQVFGNSVELIQKSGIIELEPDSEAIKLFLQHGYIAAPRTPFKNLKKMPPFAYIEITQNGIQLKNVFNYEKFIKRSQTNVLSLNDNVAEYEKIHKQAIKNRIHNKPKIAVLLSGGYDSGGNLCSLRDVYSGTITAYSVGFKNSTLSEVPLAKKVADSFNAKLVPLILDGTEIDDLPKIITAFEEPFFENGVFINYKAAQSINANETDVVLGGDGNDQFFGTGSREIALNVLSKKTGLILIQKLLLFISSYIPFFSRLKFHNESILYAMDMQHFGFSKSELRKLIPGTTTQQHVAEKSPRTLNFDQLYLWRNYHTDIEQSALQVINLKAAKLANQANLNITFPYADNQVFDFVNGLSVKHKVKGTFKELIYGKGKSKFIFKEYLKHKLPGEITNRKKQGGFTPLNIYLDNSELRKNIYGFIRRTLPATKIFQNKVLNKKLDDIEKFLKRKNEWFWQRQKQQIRLMYLLVLSFWWRIYINKDRRQKLSDYFIEVQ